MLKPIDYSRATTVVYTQEYPIALTACGGNWSNVKAKSMLFTYGASVKVLCLLFLL